MHSPRLKGISEGCKGLLQSALAARAHYLSGPLLFGDASAEQEHTLPIQHYEVSTLFRSRRSPLSSRTRSSRPTDMTSLPSDTYAQVEGFPKSMIVRIILASGTCLLLLPRRRCDSTQAAAVLFLIVLLAPFLLFRRCSPRVCSSSQGGSRNTPLLPTTSNPQYPHLKRPESALLR